MFKQIHFNILIFSILFIFVFSSSALAQRIQRKKVIPSVKLGLTSVMLLTPSLSIRSLTKTSNATSPIVMPYIFWEKVAFTQFGFELGFSPMAFRSGILNVDAQGVNGAISAPATLSFNETGYYFSMLTRAYLAPQKSKRKYFYPFVSLGLGFFITTTTFQTVHGIAPNHTPPITERYTSKTSTKAFVIIPSASIGTDFLFRQTAGFRLSLGLASGSQKDWSSSKTYRVVYDYLSPKFTLGVFVFY